MKHITTLIALALTLGTLVSLAAQTKMTAKEKRTQTRQERKIAQQKVKEQLQEMEWTGSITDYTSVLKDWNEDLQKGIYARVPHCMSQEEVQKEIEHICDDVDDFDI